MSTADSPTNLKAAAIALAGVFVGASVMGLYVNRDALLGQADAGPNPVERYYEFDIVGKDIDMGGGAVWHAWTFNGTVPGPTITATVGDVITVKVTNTLDIVHSLHTHLSPYSLPNDGSQLNTITGIGGMAMIPPGESYTYSFLANIPGVFYYHCHSADGGHTISQHIAQGLYGAILVRAAEEPQIREEVLFMAERGFDVSGNAPFYIMNGRGLPGGEHHLEEIFKAEGVQGVAAQFGKTLPAIQGKVGEPIRLAVVNIGDQIHSFHMHAMTAYSVDMNPGRPVPAQVVGLVPGEADRVVFTPTQEGIWLFHCHVVSHADAGMIGVFVVGPADAA